MIKETVHVVDAEPLQPGIGSAGLRGQLPGRATTVSNVARATGGIGRGQMIERDIK